MRQPRPYLGKPTAGEGSVTVKIRGLGDRDQLLAHQGWRQWLPHKIADRTQVIGASQLVSCAQLPSQYVEAILLAIVKSGLIHGCPAE
jgi:hypothetical protein